jgi:hypothetical protein
VRIANLWRSSSDSAAENLRGSEMERDGEEEEEEEKKYRK